MSDRIERALDALSAWLADGSRGHPRAVAVGALLLTAVSLWLAATHLVVDTDPDRMTSPDLPFRRTNARIEERFPQLSDNLVVIVEADAPADALAAAKDLAKRLQGDTTHVSSVFFPAGDPFFDRHGLLYLPLDRVEWIASTLEDAGPLLTRLEAQPHLAELAERTAQGLAGEAPWDRVLDASSLWLEMLERATDRWLAGHPEPVAWGGLLEAFARRDLPSRQILAVQPTRDFRGFGPARSSMDAVDRAAAALPPSPGLRVRVTGDVAVLTQEMSMVERQVVFASVGSLLLILLVLIWSLRSFRLLIATLVTLLAGLAWTAGFAALAVGYLNVLTIAFGVLYIGLGVDFGIHYALAFRERRAHGDEPPRALHVASDRVGSSLVFCALTTAIGFFAFLPTSYTGVAELGLISGGGVFLGLIATLTLFPALLTLGLGRSPKLADPTGAALHIWMPSLPLRRPRTVCAVAALLAIGSAALIPRIRFDDDPLNVRDPRVESVIAMKELLSEGEEAPWTAEVLAPDPAAAEALRPRLEALPEVGRVVTVRDFLPERQQAKHARLAQAAAALAPAPAAAPPPLEEAMRALRAATSPDDAGWEPGPEALADTLLRVEDARQAGRLPGSVDELERLLFADLGPTLDALRERLEAEPVDAASLPAEVRDRYLGPGGSARVEIFPSGNLREHGALAAFADAVRTVSPDAGGAVVATVEFARTIVSALREALGLAVAAIVVLLFVLWRSVRYTLFALVPLALGSLLTAAFTVLAHLPLNFANVIVLPLILGIGVDSGIHLVHRHRLRDDPDPLHSSTARAVFFSALTSIVSFATLGFASHQGIASLSRLLVAGLGFVLLSNLVVLPALLTWLDPPPGPSAGPDDGR